MLLLNLPESQSQAGVPPFHCSLPQVDYPLFTRARQIWKEHQPHHSVFVSAMEAAGFDVEVAVQEYPASLPKATWLAMMRSRFWSTFSYCSDAELEQVQHRR